MKSRLLSALRRLALLLCFAAAPLALAQPAPSPDAPAAVDADRFHTLTSELRCLVCQNESLADSNAPLAIDLKNEIRARMAAGDSDDALKRFLVERYGDFVTYRPPLDARTLALWLVPPLLVLIGGFAMWCNLRPNAGGDKGPGSRRGGKKA